MPTHMDDFRQSAAPAARRRRSASGGRLLGLLVVLAVVLLLPGHALADRVGAVPWQAAAGTSTVLEVASDGELPLEPSTPVADETAPAEPAPSEPPPSEPPPSEPPPSEPPPSEPAPAPSEPAPGEPAPSEPAPAPPAEEIPADPEPAPGEPVPSEPAPRDDRGATPKPPASEERQLPTGDEVSAPAVALAPTAPVASAPADADPAGAPDREAGEERAERQAKVVRRAYERLGLGTIAAPAAVDDGASPAAAPAQACTPIGAIVASAAPHDATGLPTHTPARPHRGDDESPLVRGPPAPLDSPSSPIATVAGASAGTGGVNGERDCGILADQVVLTLAERGYAVATDCCDHLAPAPANAAARAPPVA